MPLSASSSKFPRKSPRPSTPDAGRTPVGGVFCFRRDLRLDDNLGLNALVRVASSRVLPVFCLDPRQVHPGRNAYRSDASIRFMFESLLDLDAQIRARSPDGGLLLLHASPETVLPALARHVGTAVVGWNADVTPFALARDEAITRALRAKVPGASILVNREDLTVVPLDGLATQSGTPYKKFTPFLLRARAKGVRPPVALPKTVRFVPRKTLVASLPPALSSLVVPMNALIGHDAFRCPATRKAVVAGGRAFGRARLTPSFLCKHCHAYAKERETPSMDRTTRLSAYLKFGCVSFREAHAAIESALHAHPVAREALTRELFWNTFYAYITQHFPHVLQGQLKGVRGDRRFTSQGKMRNMEMKTNLHKKVDQLWVSTTTPAGKSALRRWTTGTTGFPFVDAAMRQLLRTGWMHNRARMVVASFLTKDLRIDWREGERHFATYLVDYDPSANNGGWQWAASTGADAQPYFRIFNPWTQSEKYDRDGAYIFSNVPELRSVRAKDLHRWHLPMVREAYANDATAAAYPPPMVDHNTVRTTTLRDWKKCM